MRLSCQLTNPRDIKAIKANNAYNHALASSNSTSFNNTTLDWDCDYVEYSTVPDQTGGAFWSILNRLFIGRLESPAHSNELTADKQYSSVSF